MKKLQLISMAALVASLAWSGCKKEEAPAPPPAAGGIPCTYTVGPWSAWSNGIRTRSVSASPDGCTGTAPASTEEHYCNSTNAGWLTVINYSTNPYRVTITGSSTVPSFTLQGGYMMDSILVNVGTYGIHALQLSGYVFTPSEFNATKNVSRCNVVSWSFP